MTRSEAVRGQPAPSSCVVRQMVRAGVPEVPAPTPLFICDTENGPKSRANLAGGYLHECETIRSELLARLARVVLWRNKERLTPRRWLVPPMREPLYHRGVTDPGEGLQQVVPVSVA